MNREKQIEEMAEFMTEGVRPWVEDAEALYNAGYRKASDLAEEIFAEIHESIKAEKFHHKNFGYLVYLADIDRILAELKKKYTECGE